MTVAKNNGINRRSWAHTITTTIFLIGVVLCMNQRMLEGLEEITLNLDRLDEHVSRLLSQNHELRLENGLLRLEIDQLRLEKTCEKAADASRPQSPLQILVK